MSAAQDEIRFQVIWSNLIAIVEEQARMLMRTAFSPVVRDSGDLSAALFDRAGNMLAQAQTGTPGHVNSTVAAVPQMLAVYPADTLAEGDHIITNDPWLATGHLPDITARRLVLTHMSADLLGQLDTVDCETAYDGLTIALCTAGPRGAGYPLILGVVPDVGALRKYDTKTR